MTISGGLVISADEVLLNPGGGSAMVELGSVGETVLSEETEMLRPGGGLTLDKLEVDVDTGRVFL